MLEFLTVNFNLPTLLVAAVVFGGTGWLLWHSHKSGGACSSCGGCSGGCSCGGGCSGHCGGRGGHCHESHT